MPKDTGGEEQYAFAVDAYGQVETEVSRLKEVAVQTAILDAANHCVDIDMERVVGGSWVGDGDIVVILTDFSMPPRTVRISADFRSYHEINSSEFDDEQYQAAPRTLNVRCGWAGDESDGTLDRTISGKGDLESYVRLERGGALGFQHSGASYPFRNEVLPHDTEISVSRVYDLGRVEEGNYNGDSYNFPTFLVLNYDANTLRIHGTDSTNAIVLYSKVIDISDHRVKPEDEDQLTIDQSLLEAIEQLEVSDAFAAHALRQFAADYATTVSELETARNAERNLESLLARNRRLLAVSQSDLRANEFEIRRLQERVRRLEETSTAKSDPLLDQIFGHPSGSDTDPFGHTAVLGFDPKLLFALDPRIASNLVESARRAYGKHFHSDLVGDGVDTEIMKRINVAVDKVKERLERGHWGRN